MTSTAIASAGPPRANAHRAAASVSRPPITAAGAGVHRGTLDDLDGLRGAAAADGVIHLAYVHDFSDIAAAGVIDLRAVEAIGAALDLTGVNAMA